MRQRDADSLESRHITSAAGRTQYELRRAALLMATVTMEDPDLTDEPAQIDDLSLVLEVLGYRTKFSFGGPNFRTDALGRIDRHHRAALKPCEAKRKARRYEAGETEVTATPTRSHEPRRHGLERICGVDRGTLRGYNRHINAYNTPCTDCLGARLRQLADRWERLGLPEYARTGVKIE